MALLSINMKAIWRASFLKSCEQADQCNNSGETEEVLKIINNKLVGTCYLLLTCIMHLNVTSCPLVIWLMGVKLREGKEEELSFSSKPEVNKFSSRAVGQ